MRSLLLHVRVLVVPVHDIYNLFVLAGRPGSIERRPTYLHVLEEIDRTAHHGAVAVQASSWLAAHVAAVR